MPPKIKITREDIVRTALELVRAKGTATLNARAVAEGLGCSTQPIFSNFATMEELQQAVIEAAHAYYLRYLKAEAEEGRYPPYKAFGMAYIRFAGEERELFRLLFMRDRGGEGLTPTEDFETSVLMIMQANGLSRERAERMHLEMWSCTHGLATMLATSFFTPEWEVISDMLSDVYQGLRTRHILQYKEENHGNNCHSD